MRCLLKAYYSIYFTDAQYINIIRHQFSFLLFYKITMWEGHYFYIKGRWISLPQCSFQLYEQDETSSNFTFEQPCFIKVWDHCFMKIGHLLWSFGLLVGVREKIEKGIYLFFITIMVPNPFSMSFCLPVSRRFKLFNKLQG